MLSQVGVTASPVRPASASSPAKGSAAYQVVPCGGPGLFDRVVDPTAVGGSQ